MDCRIVPSRSRADDPRADDPPRWLDALKAAVSSGAIANLSISTLTDGNPAYGGLHPMDWKYAPVTASVMARAKSRSRSVS